MAISGQATTLYDFKGDVIKEVNPLPVSLYDSSGNSVIETNPNGDVELSVRSNGIISSGNSTTTTLASGVVFTGDWEEIKDYGIIKVNIYSDQSASIGGLQFQQSPDQVTIFDEPYDYTGGTYKLFTPNPVARYFRIVYTNGSVAQTSFSLQTIYNYVYTKPTSHRLGDNVVGNDDTELVKSVLAYKSAPDDIYRNVGVQNPFPVDGDSVYDKDIWEDESNINNFSGEISDIFNNLHTVIADSTANNPKELFIHFNRTIISNVVGLGSYTGNFSNTKIEIYTSGDVATTVIDESSDNTKYTSRTFQLPTTAGFNAIKFSFATTDTISISNCVIVKTRGVIARLQATKPDNTVTDINATNGGNLKISLEEVESGISTNSNSQINTSPYPIDEFGNYSHILGDNIFKGSLITIPPEHHEIHCGDAYFSMYTADLGNGASVTLAIVVPNEGLTETEEGDQQNIKQYHAVFYVDSEAEVTIEGYVGGTLSSNGTAINVFNRNGNSSRTDYLGVYHTPTVTSTGTKFYDKRIGSGRSVGGEAGRGSEFVLTDNSVYLLTITNAVTTNTYVNIELDYYVHPGV